MQRLLIALLAVAVGGGAGFAAGRYSILYRNPMMGVDVPERAPASRFAGRSGALDSLLVEDAFERATAIAALGSLSDDEIGDVQRALQTVGVERDAVDAILLVRLWARRDPEAATTWAFTKPQYSFRDLLISAAVEEWAAQDPQTAAVRVDGFTRRMDSDITEAAEKALMRGWFDSGSFLGVEDYLIGRGVSFDQLRSIKTFVRRMTQRGGPEATIEWVEAINDEDWRFKLGAFRQAAGEIAMADPQLAIAWCEKHCEGEYGDGLEKQIANGWLIEGRATAFEWLSSMKPGIERDTAVLSVYRYWWQRDRGGEARRWLESVGTEGLEPWMEPAVQIYAPVLALENPTEAAKWAVLAPEADGRREATLMAVGRRWWAQDEDAAEAWLATAPMSEEAREKARGGLRRSGLTK